MAEESIEEVQEVPTEEKSKSSKKLPILVMVPVVAILAFFLITKVVNPRFAPANGSTTQKVKKKVKKKKESYIHQIESVVANPAKSDNKRIMKVSASLEAGSKSILKMLEIEQVMLAHLLLMILSSKTIGVLSTAEGKSALQEELRQTFVAELGLQDDDISHVYFSEFVIQ